jgi:hypothetical protein
VPKKTRRPMAGKKEQSGEFRVGIFWVLNGKPLINSTALSEAEPYGNHLSHPQGHAEVWEQWQGKGVLSPDMEYDEPPRGRVMHNTKTRRFTLLADRCILRDKEVVRKIKSQMSLPRNTETDTDSHYRCLDCLRARSD